MGNPIEENASKILIALFENNPKEELQFDGNDLENFTELTPQEINNAVDFLDERGLLNRLNYLGTAPYNFGHVYLNAKGNYIYHDLVSAHESPPKTPPIESGTIGKQPLAAGSPYGFTDQDWEYVQKETSWNNKIKVILGYQFKSEFYDSESLIANTKQEFQNALNEYNNSKGLDIELSFKPLSAGYGEHLFNQIARDIISCDIAIFETSDLNPNVMIEMGVALTWGKRVLPIKLKGKPKPPSDISGQTYANYVNDAKDFESETHKEDILAMIERAIQKKRKS